MRSSIGRSATRRDQATPASRRGALLVACAAVCWSSGGLIARLVTTSPWTTSLWRSLFASLFLVVVLWIARRRSILAQWRDGGRPVVAVAVCMALASTCFLFSLAHTSVANTLILISTGPYVAGLLGWLWLGERVALPFSEPLETGVRDLGLLALFGVGNYGTGFLLFMAGARSIPAAQSALVGMLETVLGPLWVWLVLNERPGVATLTGGALIL